MTGMPLPLPAAASSFMYRESGQEQDSVQSDRHLLFGVSIEQQQQPLVGSSSGASLLPHAQIAKNKDHPQSLFAGNNMPQSSYRPSASPEVSTMTGVGLDDNGMFQRGAPWPAMSPAPMRTFTKVKRPLRTENIQFLGLFLGLHFFLTSCDATNLFTLNKGHALDSILHVVRSGM